MLHYTTTENIARRLRGRLEFATAPVVGTSLGSAQTYGPVIGGQIIDPEVLQQLGEQKEAYIDLILGQLYEIPLALTSPITKSIMAEITECLVIGAIMKVHFQGALNSNTGGDITGTGVDSDRQAYLLLGTLTVGHNIFLPQMSPPLPSTFPGAMPPQPLVLPGESLKITQPDTIHRVNTFVGARNSAPVLKTVDWGQGRIDLYKKDKKF